MARFYFQGFDGNWYVADDHTTSMLEVLQRRMDGAYKRLMEKERQMTTFEKIRAEILNFKEKCNASDYLGCGILEIIDKYTEQEPKTGHWIIIDDCEKFIAKCSECGRIEDSRMISKYPYCHCGAKMVEPQESEG